MKIVTGQIANLAGVSNAAPKESAMTRSVTNSGSDTVQFGTGARYLEAAMRERSLEAISACIEADTYAPSSAAVAQHLVDKGFGS